MAKQSNPTTITYEGFDGAYRFFNENLFGGKLPHCLVTLQRKNKCNGYFYGEIFTDGKVNVDEIALNPSQFSRGMKAVLATLLHEMVHVWQFHLGSNLPKTGAYHNKEWGNRMELVGLIPSNTGLPGGKKVGVKMTHYIEPDGMFEIMYDALIKSGWSVPYFENAVGEEKKKAPTSKNKYSCSSCGLVVWGKPELNIICGDCEEPLEQEI